MEVNPDSSSMPVATLSSLTMYLGITLGPALNSVSIHDLHESKLPYFQVIQRPRQSLPEQLAQFGAPTVWSVALQDTRSVINLVIIPACPSAFQPPLSLQSRLAGCCSATSTSPAKAVLFLVPSISGSQRPATCTSYQSAIHA